MQCAGGYAQKHSAGLYSATPPKEVFQLPDLEDLQAAVNAKPVRSQTFQTVLQTSASQKYQLPHIVVWTWSPCGVPWRDECLACHVEVVNTEPEGKATVESFTVHHNRENLPFRGVIVGRLENGAPPSLAKTTADRGQ